jgi:hypothetical protein
MRRFVEGFAAGRRWLWVIGLAAALAASAQQPVTKRAEVPGAKPPPVDAFAETHAGLEGATTEDCLGCHAEGRSEKGAHGAHPLGVDLDAAASRSKGSLRGAREVRARGVALEDGKIGCLSCHTLASKYQHRIALPPGAEVRRAVVPGDKSTYDPEHASAAAAPAHGEATSTKPLCQACHVY